MKVNELVAGLFFLVVAGLFAAGAWSLPNPSQQPLGPSAFPLILAGLLTLCAALLAWQGARAPERAPALALADWTRSPAALARLLLVPGAVLFYVLASEALGFLITAAVILATLFLAGGGPAGPALPLALAAALVMHSIFYLVLGVQLPWGPLEPVRW